MSTPQILALALAFANPAVSYYYNQPEPAPFNATAYSEMISCISQVSEKYYIAIDHGSVCIMPPEGDFIEEDGPEIDQLTFCLDKADSVKTAIYGNWEDDVPRRRLGEASTEWAEKEGGEGLKMVRRWRENLDL